MSIERILRLLTQKESMTLEFKKASSALPKNLFESICAMLNRNGGDILLGVNDYGELIGIEEAVLSGMLVDISNLSNNPQKLKPPFILHPTIHTVEGRHLIHIQVPSSSQIHDTAGVVYDRSSDGDFKALQPHQIAALHNHKRNFYSESMIFPRLCMDDFNSDLFIKVRLLIRSNKPNHPWLVLDDEQLLRTAGLWRKDYDSGDEGFTLAAVLLFGKDEVIQQILPHYKIDAILRVEDVNRYDDRLYIQTNLIDAYDLLMSFVEKHLPDKFFLQGDQRISLRSQIFREVVANIIVHREYTNAHPCTFVIQKDKVICENANNPHGEGPIDPKHFAPFPKNPTLAKFFIQLGRVDELGSGVLNVYRLLKDYVGKGQPVFIEGNTFSMQIPIPQKLNEGAFEGTIEGAIEGAFEGATKMVEAKLIKLIQIIASNEGNRSPELQKKSGLTQKTLERYLKVLRYYKMIEFRGDAPQTGGYFLTDKTKEIIQLNEHRSK